MQSNWPPATDYDMLNPFSVGSLDNVSFAVCTSLPPLVQNFSLRWASSEDWMLGQLRIIHAFASVLCKVEELCNMNGDSLY